MDREEFDAKVVNPVADKPQLVGLANFHLGNLWAAVAGLGDLGHRVAVDFAAAPAPLEWPKMLYMGAGTAPGETTLVETTADEKAALAAGWRKTPKAA